MSGQIPLTYDTVIIQNAPENKEGALLEDKFKFEIQSRPMPELQDREVLVENHFFSPDPFVRVLFLTSQSVGQKVRGFTVGKVVSSKHPDYHEGQYVMGLLEASTHSVATPDKPNVIKFIIDSDPSQDSFSHLYHVKPSDRVSLSAFLGVTGMPGITAYVGLKHYLKISKGATVVVTGAAGCIGSLVGQLLKHQGAGKVIGIAGSKEKCDLLLEYGFDVAVNYKDADYEAQLSKACEGGVDGFWDNVGGKTMELVLKHLKNEAPVVSCGSMSSYLPTPEEEKAVNEQKQRNQQLADEKKTKIVQYVVASFPRQEWVEAIEYISDLINKGVVKYQETETDGLENIGKAHDDIFKGRNVGKQVLRVKICQV